MTSSILVLGLGELGDEVVKSLATHPQRGDTRLAVLLRSKKPDQIAKLELWNVSFVSGNVMDNSQADLAAIFKDFETVICCVGMFAPPETQVKIAKAVLEARVQRYFPWQFGIDYDIIGRGRAQDLFDSQLDVRDILRNQTSTKWVIVSTGMFIPFIFEPAFGLVNVERNAVTAIGSWENELTVTAPVDIGRVTAELALVDTNVKGVVYTSGDTISMSQLANVVEKVTGDEVKRTLKTVQDLKQELMEDPNDGMKKYRVVFGEGRGVAWPKEKSYNVVKGIDTQTVEDWARSNIKNP